MTETKPESTSFTPEEVKQFLGDLKPGEVGWVELDDHGKPTGAATKEPPPPGKPVARVVGAIRSVFDEVTTPTGAPITKHMNPEPTLWDEGMLARNPVPGTATPPAGATQAKAQPAPAAHSAAPKK